MRNSHFPLDAQGRLPHLQLPQGSIPDTVLLVGDPERMDLLPQIWEDVEWLAQRREFRVARGQYRGTALGCCATGIGGPAMEIAVVELAYAGARNLLRAGGCGALTSTLELGQFIAPVAMVRQGGAGLSYAPPEYPAAADWRWLASIQRAAASLGEEVRFDVGISSAAYYAGQGRPTQPGAAPWNEDWPSYWASRGATHVDMETDTLLTVGRILGMQCAALLAVHANRSLGTWLENYRPVEARLLRLASAAAVVLRDRDDSSAENPVA